MDEEDDGPLDLSWPDTFKERIIYVIRFPIIILLHITVSDVRNPVSEPKFDLLVGSGDRG